MYNWLLIELNGLADLLRGIFTYIFPEFPFAGTLVTLISFIVFAFYTIKSGLYEGVKVGLAILFILVTVLFSVHHLAKLFNPNL